MRSKTKFTIFISASVVVLILIVAGIYWQFFRPAPKDTYQAVFLTSGQVYFGKVAHQNRQFVILTDIYYLRASQALQPPKEGEESAAEQPNLSLIKLGNELHGPVDEMKINRDQILFIEDLKADSKVVEAIKEYKNK